MRVVRLASFCEGLRPGKFIHSGQLDDMSRLTPFWPARYILKCDRTGPSLLSIFFVHRTKEPLILKSLRLGKIPLRRFHGTEDRLGDLSPVHLNEAIPLSIAGVMCAACGAVAPVGKRNRYLTISVVGSEMTWIPLPTVRLVPTNSHPNNTRVFL